MLVVLLCCMMKLVEFSTGKSMGNKGQQDRGKLHHRRRKYLRGRAKTMNDVGSLGVRGMAAVSPDSDCNSNHHNSTSYLSNTSSQDIDFIQDNSDYQWFLDYGYREGGVNHHTSILSLPESYEANDLNYYDALAKNMDANLAEADMESFRTEDIHALLTNLPPMCTDHLSQENNRQGESYASVSGSIMAKFDFDDSISPHSSSHGEDSANSISICKSELLFSPVKEAPPIAVNYSVDSLDCDMMLTCQANKDNYTIAFEGSVTMYSEDSDYHETDKSDNSGSAQWTVSDMKKPVKLIDASMTQSDSGSLTTWSKLKKRNSSDNQLRRHPSGNNNNNNNNSGDETSHLGLNENSTKSQSMPNLYKQKLKSLLVSNYLNNQPTKAAIKSVKVFDIQHHNPVQSSSGSMSEMATSIDASTSDNTNKHQQHNFSLVKLFMKQKSMSTEGMSTTMDQLSSTENWPASQSGDSTNSEPKPSEKTVELSVGEGRIYDQIAEEPEDEISRSESVEQLSESISKIDEDDAHFNNNNNSYEEGQKKHLLNRSIQTSQFSEIVNLKNVHKSAIKPPQVYKVIEPSFLNKLKQEGEGQKPVYVLYPNYTLPNLDFLNDKPSGEVLLLPQEAPCDVKSLKKRPFSCNDLEMLKKKGFGHVEDWDSLNFLLPQEYRKILAQVPEISDQIRNNKPLKRRPLSCEYTHANSSSSSSTATQPSSGYRGSSTMLNDSSQHSPWPKPSLKPLFVYHYDSVTSSEASLLTSDRQKAAPPLPVRCGSLQTEQLIPPRPPLPRSILRKDQTNKRYLYETSDEDCKTESPYFLRRCSETEDEGVDAGASSSSVESITTHNKDDFFLSNISSGELAQLEEFLKISGISTSDNEELNEENLMQLRSYVGKFLSLKMNQDEGKKSVSFAEKIHVLPKQFTAPHNSPNVSTTTKHYHKPLADVAISEEVEESTLKAGNLTEKRSLVYSVTEALELLKCHFSSAKNLNEMKSFGGGCSNLLLSTLCPALYAILSDGLKPCLESSFGAIGNSVWQVVEASAQQGPLTKTLNELVMRINGEDVLTEGVVKFNAFVFGLLNMKSLDVWLSYLRTRESILKKHYTKDSLLVMTHTSGVNVRRMLDTMICELKPLKWYPFQLDLLFEYRQLHESFKRMDLYQQQLSPSHKQSVFKQWSSPKLGHSLSSNRSTSDSSEDTSATTVRHLPPDSTLPDLLNSSTSSIKRDNKERPRSCVESNSSTRPNFKLGDVTTAAKKRWSGISLSNKLYLVYDRLAKEDDEEYTDSLETGGQVVVKEDKSDESNVPSLQEDITGPESLESNDSKPLNGRRFKKLQQKWEMLSGRETSPPVSPTNTPTKSKIPRPITSPSRPQSGIPVLISPSSASKGNKKVAAVGKVCAKKPRTSRLDQVDGVNETVRHIPRPSSLPYKAATASQKTSKITPPRRAASSSLNRKTPPAKAGVPKVVRTLSHRLPSESGHLPYNEGEKLKVVLEVDDKWLLCCRGNQKGLVPKSAVIADLGRF